MLFLAAVLFGTAAPAFAQSSPPASPDSSSKPSTQPPVIVLPAPPPVPVAPAEAPKNPAAPSSTSAGTAPAPKPAPAPAEPPDAPFVLPPGALAPDPPAEFKASAPPAESSKHARKVKHGGLDFWSPEREQQMGKELDSQMLQQVQLLDDPFITSYLEDLTARIARNSDIQVPIVLRVVESSVPDSFSIPGGYVYVTVGMVRETRTEAELAAILSHEIAHIACRHATRQMTRQQVLGLLSVPLLFVGGPVAFAVGEGFSLAYPLTMLKFSRNAESEADAVGVTYMYAAGYDPNAAVSLFERVAAQESNHMVGLRRLFSTHPITRDRMAAVSREIAKLPPEDDYVVTTSRYDDVIARLSRMGYNHDPGVPTLIRRTGRPEPQP